jgi:hypothetical protein
MSVPSDDNALKVEALDLWLVSVSGVINFRLETVIITSFHVGGLRAICE